MPATLSKLTSEFYSAKMLPKALKDSVNNTPGISFRDKAQKALDALESHIKSSQSLKVFQHFLSILKEVSQLRHIAMDMERQINRKL